MPVKPYSVILVFLCFSCTEEKNDEISKNLHPVGQPIVGDPILSVEDDLNNSEIMVSSEGPEISVINEFKDLNSSSEEVVEEGFVVNGVRKINDQNITELSIVSNLPPLDENSGYESLPFRDLTNFAYEVSWEDDGMEFDFSAYSKRVPKLIRDQNGLAVAVEGFMIPTIVDENNKVKEFLLLPDQMSCCFGQSPEANGWVVVSAPNGVEVLMDQVIRVMGNLTVEERWDEEFFVGLYHLDCNEITSPSL